MARLDELLRRFDGQPIRHCPGRYVLRGVDEKSGPAAVVTGPAVTTEHVLPRARDKVVVTRLGRGGTWGLISYARADGTWLHTANTPDGFARKLADLGIEIPNPGQDGAVER